MRPNFKALSTRLASLIPDLGPKSFTRCVFWMSISSMPYMLCRRSRTSDSSSGICSARRKDDSASASINK